MDRLEDLRIDWQNHCARLLDEGVTEKGRETHLREWTENTLVPECFAWLGERHAWPNAWIENETTRNRAQKQILAALQHLPAEVAPTTKDVLQVPPWSWSISAGLGAMTGMLIGTPFSLLLTGERLLGLSVGGIVGAAALTGVVSYLADRPRLRELITAGLVAGSTLSALGGIWKTLTGNARSIPFFRASFTMLTCALVLFLARPRLKAVSGTAPNDADQLVTRVMRAHAADLVLAWIWAHPDRAVATSSQLSNGAVPNGFLEAMTELQCDVGAESDEARRRYAEEMIHQFSLLGYEWHFVSRGAQFNETMRANFVPWGIEPQIGDSVRTIKPAITLHGKNLVRGQLQRLKS
jgi:hypothetical protein